MREKDILKRNISLILMIFFLLSGVMFARGIAPYNNSFAKADAEGKTRSLSNMGNWLYWMYSDGQSGIDPGGSSGGVYPRGTAGVIFQDGIVWGCVLRGVSTEDQRIRVGGQTYFIGTQPGDFDAGANQGLFRVRPDWQTLTLADASVRRDAMEVNMLGGLGEVSDAQMQSIIDQYALDWANWPVESGAPYYDVDSSGTYNPVMIEGTSYPDQTQGDFPGIASSDMTVFFVVNDDDVGMTNAMYGSDPIGIELQATVWSYNMPTAGLGQIIFKKYKFINKSDYHLDSMYVAQWCDPDLGDYGDDYVGCDVDLSIGFSYNSQAHDHDFDAFGLPPGAMGYDFFQGPLIDGVLGMDINNNGVDDAADYGVYNLQQVGPGKVNMPMTSFFYFASGSPYNDPENGSYTNGTLKFYNLLNGRPPVSDTVNTPYYLVGSGPNAGDSTIFPLSGDPINDLDGTQGDLDGFGTNLAASDRRMGVNTGPFHLAPGADQEIVLAVIGGMGSFSALNPQLSSLADLKNTDILAQELYNDLFKSIPKPPVQPKVTARPFEDYILLEWGSDLAGVAATEADNPKTGYNFEGYNVYQLPSAAASLDQGSKVATFDIVNDVQAISEFSHVTPDGDTILVVGQSGVNSGITRYIKLDNDYVNDAPFYMGKKYYFTVTAYNHNPNPQLIPNYSLESGSSPVEVIPQSPDAGYRYEVGVEDAVEASHAAGGSDGQVIISVVDPTAVTGNEYQIFFEEDDDTLSATYGEIVWGLMEGTEVKAEKLVINASTIAGEFPIIDGLMFKIAGPLPSFKDFYVTQNAGGVVDPPAGAGADYQGFPGLGRTNIENQQINGSTWFVTSNDNVDPSYERFVNRIGAYAGGYGEAVNGIAWLPPRDFEVRFTASGSPAFFNWPNNNGVHNVPFEVWCINDAANPDDDYQCYPWINEIVENSTFEMVDVDHAISGGTNDPYTESIYWVEPISQDQAGYDNLVQLHNDFPADAANAVLWAYYTESYDGHDWNAVAGMGRMAFANWNGGDVTVVPPVYDATMPEEGTIFRLVTTKPIATDDEWTFSAPGVSYDADLAEKDVKKVNVFPNPYYAFNSESTSRFDAHVTFNNLPVKATIRIFNLIGEQVKKFDKESPSQFLKWDLKNESGLPVGSGIFIVHIKMPDQNVEKILKLFVIQRAEILEYF